MAKGQWHLRFFAGLGPSPPTAWDRARTRAAEEAPRLPKATIDLMASAYGIIHWGSMSSTINML